MPVGCYTRQVIKRFQLFSAIDSARLKISVQSWLVDFCVIFTRKRMDLNVWAMLMVIFLERQVQDYHFAISQRFFIPIRAVCSYVKLAPKPLPVVLKNLRTNSGSGRLQVCTTWNFRTQWSEKGLQRARRGVQLLVRFMSTLNSHPSGNNVLSAISQVWPLSEGIHGNEPACVTFRRQCLSVTCTLALIIFTFSHANSSQHTPALPFDKPWSFNCKVSYKLHLRRCPENRGKA